MLKSDYFSHNYTFRCEKCHFITDNKKDYRRHTESAKHARMTKATTTCAVNLPTSEPNTLHSLGNIYPSLPNYPPTPQNSTQVAFIFEKHIYKYCEKCGNKYYSKSGLWKHKKTCNGTPTQEHSQPFAPSPTPACTVPAPTAHSGVTAEDLKTIMFDMFKNNQEFQNKLIEMMCSQQSIVINAVAAATAAASAASAASSIPNSNNYNGPTNTTTNSNNNNNNNNNTFNLQFFLNEHCKDAMNINEFANTISLKDADLDEFGRMGYVQGMSKL